MSHEEFLDTLERDINYGGAAIALDEEYDRPLISTPCDETLPEWMTVAGWVAFTFLAIGCVTLARFGLFAAGSPSIWPALKSILHLFAKLVFFKLSAILS